MIHDIARSAVIRKTQKDVNIMTGNYEAAFALGLLSKICQVTVESQCRSVADMKVQFFEKADGYEPRNEREQILIQMLKNYKPSDVWDEDVEIMFARGLAEDTEILSKEKFFH